VSGAAVMVRSFIGLTTNPTGVEPDRVLVALVGGGLAGPDAATRFDRINRIHPSLAALPGVEAKALMRSLATAFLYRDGPWFR